MAYNELRKDYLLNRWVVIATERSRRPTDFVKTKRQATNLTDCPMCAGNEKMTPPAIMLYLKENGGIVKSQDPAQGERPKNWLIRTIPNLYPAFSPPKKPGQKEKILIADNFGHAIGYHEVVVESPNHNEDPSSAELSQLKLLINAYIDRFIELSDKPYIKYVSIFRNYGLEAGASLSHAHSQVIATPIVPTTIQEEQDASAAFYSKADHCIFCDIIERETKGARFILENNDFVVLAPYASVNPMEFWIIPKKHASNIQNLSSSEIMAFAKTLKASLGALKKLVNDPPYNYGIHQTIEGQGSYHWHLEVYPKLTTWAGFEKSTGIYINTITPETAADSFRQIIKPSE